MTRNDRLFKSVWQPYASIAAKNEKFYIEYLPSVITIIMITVISLYLIKHYFFGKSYFFDAFSMLINILPNKFIGVCYVFFIFAKKLIVSY